MFSIGIDDPETGRYGELLVDFKLIRNYLFYKEYNKAYDDLSYYLEDNAKEFIKKVENDYWFKNIIDDKAISDTQDFKDYVLEYHYDLIEFEEYETEDDDYDDYREDED